MSTCPYEKPNRENLKNLYQHLTNYAINKHSGNFFSSDDPSNANVGFKRSIAFLKEFFQEKNLDFNALWEEIKQIAIKTLISIQPILKHRYNSMQPNDHTGSMCFEILGFDILVDENQKPYLLEVNHAPSFNTDTIFDKKNKGDLLKSVFELIGVSLSNRNELIKNDRLFFEERKMNQKFKRLTCEEKELKKNDYRTKHSLTEKQFPRLEKIFPLDLKNELHDRIYEFAAQNLDIRTGVNNKKKRKLQELQENQEILCFKKKKNIGDKNKLEMIMSSINRLYKLPSQKENIEPKKNIQIQPIKSLQMIPMNVVNLQLEL